MRRWLVILGFSGFLLSGWGAEDLAKGSREPDLHDRAGDSREWEFFENKVRPILVDHCFRCHGEEPKKVKGGLRLSSRMGMVSGGDSGAAMVPGDAERSLIIQAIRYKDAATAMPPKRKLSDVEIGDLTKWVAMGAPWPSLLPKGEEGLVTKAPYDWEKLRREHWSFRPVILAKPPQVEDGGWAKTEFDRLVFAGLAGVGLKPNPQADSRILIRRAYLDLIGLPPTAAQVKEFLSDTRPEAFSEVVDELLESEHYGERWGRHWLDVARYSDGLGGSTDGPSLPYAWSYRDWVVKSLNADLPYDQFVSRQIAGDLEKPEAYPVGTGFFAVGPTYISDGNDPAAQLLAQAETISDRVDTFSRAFLGLTVACARCHDHKFDPITTKDYYAIAGVFHNSAPVEISLASKESTDAHKFGQEKIREAQKILNEFTKDGEGGGKKGKRSLVAGEQEKIDQLKANLDRAKKDAPMKPVGAHILKDTGRADMHVAIRGDLGKRGDLVPRRFLEIIAGANAPHFTEGSGRRELAAAVVRPDNPLTARVMVNRVWQWHFGEGLVRTSGNFGILGEKPTHPEVLDWLAARFVENGWSLKWLHREILRSATWQMSSAYDGAKFAIDGDNRRLWRMNPRKLEVEDWRDSLLAVSGELDPTVGGVPIEKILESPRRSIYAKISRSGDQFDSDAFFRLFDFPPAQATADRRATTTVPQQYLFMMNNLFMLKRAKALAHLLEPFGNDEERIRVAYERLYGRLPEDQEMKAGMNFLRDHPENWPKYAQVLLSTHEFMQIQ